VVQLVRYNIRTSTTDAENLSKEIVKFQKLGYIISAVTKPHQDDHYVILALEETE
jgi:hypothetical protein